MGVAVREIMVIARVERDAEEDSVGEKGDRIYVQKCCYLWDLGLL